MLDGEFCSLRYTTYTITHTFASPFKDKLLTWALAAVYNIFCILLEAYDNLLNTYHGDITKVTNLSY